MTADKNLYFLIKWVFKTTQTSDSDFCDLLNELFHMNKKNFFEKNQILKSYFEVPASLFLVKKFYVTNDQKRPGRFPANPLFCNL